MALVEFLAQLRDTGEVLVPAELGERDHVNDAKKLLSSFYEEDALEFPGRAPVFDPSAALWAANLMLDCCQILVLRLTLTHGSSSPHGVPPEQGCGSPVRGGPSTVWSCCPVRLVCNN